MRRKSSALLLLCMLMWLFIGCAEDMLDPVDHVEIISLLPEKDIADGELVNFTMEVFYNLASSPTGTLFVAYNTGEPNRASLDLRTLHQVKDRRGYQQFQFGVTVHKWEKEPFIIYVTLAEDPFDYRRVRTFARDSYSITTKD
jgi:hypothetical protein